MDARNFTAESTTDEVIAGLDQSGKRVLVTGASAGLGIETSRVMAAAGASVTMAVRSLDKGETAKAGILEQHPGADLELLQVDLSDQASVRRAAAEFLGNHDRLHVLINNAGVMACPLSRNPDGCEHQFGTNHIGHFLFTCLLEPALVAAAPSRVVNLSSRGHHLAGVDFDDIQFEQREYQKWLAYGQAKTANILFSVELQRRLGPKGVEAFAVHPGVIQTELSRHLVQEDFEMLMKRSEEQGASMKFKSIPQGAATSVWAATAPELAGQGGIYLEDCGTTYLEDVSSEAGYRSYAVDPDIAARLWAVSEQIVEQDFAF